MPLNTMKYKLTEDDYLLLYPLLSPEKIKDTFCAMSKTPRYIQLLYKRKGLPNTDIAMDKLFERSFAIADINITEIQWSNAFSSVITKELCERIQIIQDRAERYEELFK
jgi:hypothetical protein